MIAWAKKSTLFCLLGMTLAHANAFAQTTFDIQVVDKGSIPKIGLVISRFQVAPDVKMEPKDLRPQELILDNLELTGGFRIYKVPTSDIDSLRKTLVEEDIEPWRQRDIEFVVWGKIDGRNEDIFSIQVTVWDVFRRREHKKISHRVTKAQLPAVFNDISEEVYRSITGFEGWFSQKISYVSKGKKEGRNWYRAITSALNGSEARVLLEASSPILGLVWAPSGKSFAYTLLESGKSQIWLQNVETGKRVRIAGFQGINSAPAWSHDGSHLAFTLSLSGNPDIYVLNLAQRKLRRITKNPSIDTEPVWLDEQTLLFTSDRAGKGPQIWSVKVRQGSAPEQITNMGKYNVSATVSKKNGQIAIISAHSGGYKLASVEAKTGKIKALSDSRMAESPRYDATGDFILFSTYSKDKRALAVYNFETGDVRVLPIRFGQLSAPSWVPEPRKP